MRLEQTVTMGEGSVTVNGRRYAVPAGASVSVVNGRLRINGQDVADSADLAGIVRLEVQGDVGRLDTDAPVTVMGNVTGDVKAGGSVRCGHVGGSVRAGGSVQCDDVAGDVRAGGSVSRRGGG